MTISVKIVAIVLFGADALIHVFACATDRMMLRRITKVLLMPLLAFVYISWANTLLWQVLAALFCGWMGDIFLIFPNSSLLIPGLGSFIAGHCFYISAMHRSFAPLPFYAYIIGAIVAAGVAAVGYSRITKHITPDKRVASIVYFLMLTLLNLGSLLILFTGNSAGAFLLAGSLLFLTSDTILAYQFFTAGGEGAALSVAVMSTYIAAQAFLATGFICAF